MTFSDGDAKIPIKFGLKNAGRIPAIHGWIPLALIIGIGEPQRLLACREPNSGIENDPRSVGNVIFGGQDLPQTYIIGTDSPFAPEHGKIQPDKPVTFAVSGCIRYQRGSDPTPRCTGIFGLLYSTGNDGFNLRADKRYDQTNLRVQVVPAGQFVDDCGILVR